ncbi:MAG TPA: FkbM family methyltransferase [Thermoanaerobaculia bacterium]|nr:FkbM family methyltransferase [Thermoanaerobaculia bacterium]
MTAAPFRLHLGRLRAFLWRFHTLPLADRLFAGLEAPCVLERSLFGLRLRVDVARSNPQRLLYLEGERFMPERMIVRRLLRPGMRAVDVGANIGYYLLLIESLVGPRGSVACFEPEPENLRELRRNVERNRLENVRVLPAAVGAGDGRISMRTGINAAVAGEGGGDFTVPLTSLDSALEGPVDFVKIDVEGYEGHVLAGARRLLREHRPLLFVEIHPGFLAPPSTVDGILATLREIHPRIELLEIAPQGSFGEKVKARYLGRPVRRIPDPGRLLADCRTGRREEPFWAVCTP